MTDSECMELEITPKIDPLHKQTTRTSRVLSHTPGFQTYSRWPQTGSRRLFGAQDVVAGQSSPVLGICL